MVLLAIDVSAISGCRFSYGVPCMVHGQKIMVTSSKSSWLCTGSRQQYFGGKVKGDLGDKKIKIVERMIS
jgi:hypothetical protein